MAASAIPYYRGKSLDLNNAVISNFLSRDDNPHGYLIAAAACLFSVGLLLPVLYRSTQQPKLRHSRKVALAGAAFFLLGLAAVAAMALLSPVTDDFSPLHIQLAFASFIGICAGTVCQLCAVRANRAFIASQASVLMFVLYLYFWPAFNMNLAILEWLLCANCSLALWVLVTTAERGANTKEAAIARGPIDPG